MGRKSLGEIIRWYKGRTKFEINKLGDKDAINRVPTIWQSRYYDHIVRDEKSLNKIRQYIIGNPLKCLPADLSSKASASEGASAQAGELDRNNQENLSRVFGIIN